MSGFVPSEKVARIKDQIDHPILDADGHQREFMPLVREFVNDAGDGTLVSQFDHFWKKRGVGFNRSTRSFWPFQVENVLDRVTPTVPHLLSQRLGELGLDFALLYPTIGLSALGVRDGELRGALCAMPSTSTTPRSSTATATGWSRSLPSPPSRLTKPSPSSEHAVGELGLKAVVMTVIVPRDRHPNGDSRPWIDTLGVDSQYDYDPVWRRCAELGVVPSFHGIGFGWGTRESRKSYMINHIGSFASAQEAACRSLMLSGVAARFPELRFAFLEGGVAWACQLLADTLGHYDKRNREALTSWTLLAWTSRLPPGCSPRSPRVAWLRSPTPGPRRRRRSGRPARGSRSGRRMGGRPDQPAGGHCPTIHGAVLLRMRSR